jgi:hypothetical protein
MVNSRMGKLDRHQRHFIKAAVREFSLDFALVAITNEPPETSVWNLVQGYTVNIGTYFVPLDVFTSPGKKKNTHGDISKCWGYVQQIY